MRYDALIIGAGPAGSSAARLLAQAGWRVALVEKAQFPRRKVCGEFISATTMPVLKDCGVAVPFIAAAGPLVTRVGIYAGKAMLAASREQAWGRALGREHLDVMLRDAALEAGAELFAPVEVMTVERDSDGFTGTLDDGRGIAARTVIAACGSWNAKGIFTVPQDAPSPSDLFAAAGFPRRLWRIGAYRCRSDIAVLLHPARRDGGGTRPPRRQGGGSGAGAHHGNHARCTGGAGRCDFAG